MAWKKILCPTDFSEGARESLRVAAELAVQANAELVIAHVWSPPIYFVSEPLGLPPSVVTDLVGTAQTELAAWKAEAKQLGVARVGTAFVTGAPWHEIVGLAERDRDIDLVVIGTHGRTGLAHVLLGSVAEKVVRHAPCPVLVVRRGDR